MNLTSAQEVTLGNHIRANTDTDVIQWVTDNNYNALRDFYNADASPLVWVFVDMVFVEDVKGAIDWATDYSAFKDDMEAIRFLLSNGEYRPEQPGAREALNSVFAGANATKTAILALATRHATLAESIFKATTTGPGGGDGSAQGSSAIATVKGQLTTDDVADAMNATS